MKKRILLYCLVFLVLLSGCGTQKNNITGVNNSPIYGMTGVSLLDTPGDIFSDEVISHVGLYNNAIVYSPVVSFEDIYGTSSLKSYTLPVKKDTRQEVRYATDSWCIYKESFFGLHEDTEIEERLCLYTFEDQKSKVLFTYKEILQQLKEPPETEISLEKVVAVSGNTVVFSLTPLHSEEEVNKVSYRYLNYLLAFDMTTKQITKIDKVIEVDNSKQVLHKNKIYYCTEIKEKSIYIPVVKTYDIKTKKVETVKKYAMNPFVYQGTVYWEAVRLPEKNKRYLREFVSEKEELLYKQVGESYLSEYGEGVQSFEKQNWEYLDKENRDGIYGAWYTIPDISHGKSVYSTSIPSEKINKYREQDKEMYTEQSGVGEEQKEPRQDQIEGEGGSVWETEAIAINNNGKVKPIISNKLNDARYFFEKPRTDGNFVIWNSQSEYNRSSVWFFDIHKNRIVEVEEAEGNFTIMNSFFTENKIVIHTEIVTSLGKEKTKVYVIEKQINS